MQLDTNFQKEWLKANTPSVTIEPKPTRTAQEIEDSIAEHQALSQRRALQSWPKATNERSKFKVTEDYTTFDYGE